MIFLTLGLIIISLLIPTHVKAIIVLPAIILIPLAQIIASIIGFISIPLAGLGLSIKLITKNKKLAIAVSLGILITVLIITILVLRYKYPDNPWF